MTEINLPLKLIIELLLGLWGGTFSLVAIALTPKLIKALKELKKAQQDNKCEVFYIHKTVKIPFSDTIVGIEPGIDILYENVAYFKKWIISLSVIGAILLFFMFIIIYAPGTNYWFVGGWA